MLSIAIGRREHPVGTANAAGAILPPGQEKSGLCLSAISIAGRQGDQSFGKESRALLSISSAMEEKLSDSPIAVFGLSTERGDNSWADGGMKRPSHKSTCSPRTYLSPTQLLSFSVTEALQRWHIILWDFGTPRPAARHERMEVRGWWCWC